ncbi:MAG: tetratricopeptide repeat protein [Bdellovibrionales bacterium]|nr:tetratricopeptide repeat protein [Bdellovibrionales bacterium]
MSGILSVVHLTVEKSAAWIALVLNCRRSCVSVLSPAFFVFLLLTLAALTGAQATPSTWGLTEEDRERSVILLKRQWSRDPGSADLALDLSSLLLLSGRREEAARTLLATYGQSSKERDRNRLEQKVRVISRAFVTASGAREYQGAVNAILAGNFRSALARLESVLDSEHQVFDALVRKGQVEAILGNWDSAAESLRLAGQLNPFEPELKIWLGHVLISRGEKTEGAQEVFSAWRAGGAEQRDRPHWRAWMVDALVASGRSSAARKLLAGLAQQNPAQWNSETGWLLWALIRLEPSSKPQVRRFLNLFPGGYQRLAGKSGIDLGWWDPKVFDASR